MRTFVVLFVLLVTIVARASTPTPPDVEAIAEQNGGAVVTIYGERGGQGQAVQGSGCCIGDGLVVTVAHAVKDAEQLRIRLGDGSERDAQLLEADDARDVALLKSAGLTHAATLGDAVALKPGAPLVAISAPKGLYSSVTAGIVSNTERTYDGRPVLQSDLKLDEGSSGGPVFDRAGRLIGLVRARIEEVNAATLILPINEAFDLLRRHGVPLPTQEATLFETVTARMEAPVAEKKAVDLYNKGVAAGAVEEKIELYKQAVLLSPDFFEAWFNLGATYAGAGRVGRAVHAYQRAQALKPASLEVQRNLGRALLQMNRLTEVEECFRRATELAPDDAGVHNDLGEVYRRMGRLEDARASFMRALQLRPDYAAARYNLGITYTALKRWAEALASFRSYLRLAPDAPDAEEVRAWVADLEKKTG